MANLTIKNEESPLSPIVVTEINREIGNNSCENSWLNFKLTGVMEPIQFLYSHLLLQEMVM